MENAPNRVEEMQGVVTARPCNCCGHHEIGVVIGSGEYIPLRPGMRVRIIGQTDKNSDDAML
jgi:hypothetical protein